jgi:hypothetical protein
VSGVDVEVVICGAGGADTRSCLVQIVVTVYLELACGPVPSPRAVVCRRPCIGLSNQTSKEIMQGRGGGPVSPKTNRLVAFEAANKPRIGTGYLVGGNRIFVDIVGSEW